MRFLFEKEGYYICECESCGMQIKIKKIDVSIHDNVGIITEEECFCGNVSGRIEGIPEQAPSQVVIQTIEKPIRANVPRCPTCGSINVERISLGSKAVGGYMFGLFSSNIRNTYRCKDCKYKW